MSYQTLIQFFFILVLIGFNGFFAASELAIVSLNDHKVRKLAEDGNKSAKLIIKFLEEPSRFLSTIQIGITLAGFLASASAAVSISELLADILKATDIKVLAAFSGQISLLLVTLVLSYITLVFGELVPKRVAMQNAEKIAFAVVRPVDMLSKITYPFIKVLTFSTNVVAKLFGVTEQNSGERVTEEEILLMVDVGQEKGLIHETGKRMINSIFEFDDTTVREVMTPRTSMVAVDKASKMEDILDVLISEQFSRIPVYDDSIDNIIGIFYVKDLLPLYKDKVVKDFDIGKNIHPAYFVPESKKIDVLFKEMQLRKIHMAIVIDEYGGTAGLITIEDLLEEIVGNIWDEYDEEIIDVEKIDDNTYMVDGMLSIDKFNEAMNVRLPEEEFETIGGFMVGQLGKIPSPKDEAIVEYANMVLKAEKVAKKRITKVKVYIP
ncbi:hemolysin family protein [Petroclostridium sp. X23]|uniref:hemolysin family protein n=1 Tax=Petroclostridium sp. X23 TaxID=3045146 RepID=UPI0024AD0253|nr:hemolysin family protein [Petroclostridium sp. X23]WHH61276.1 hemolysin family protein [Petroclostridium sp. X23]